MFDALYIHINVYEAFLSHGGTSKSSYFRLFFFIYKPTILGSPMAMEIPHFLGQHQGHLQGAPTTTKREPTSGAWRRFRSAQFQATTKAMEKKTPWNPLEKPGKTIGKIGKTQNIEWSMEFPAFVLSLEHLGETLIQATGMWITFGWCE